MNSHLHNLLVLLIFVVLVFVSTSNNDEFRRVINKLTTGWINTVLILLILGLSMTENLRVGLLVSVIYLISVVRFNRNLTENFSQPGPNPLDCKTYGNSKKNTGTAFYPLHAQ